MQNYFFSNYKNHYDYIDIYIFFFSFTIIQHDENVTKIEFTKI